MKTISRYLLGAVAICAFLYCTYWMAKNGSYWLWYEDMVKEIVREMVKQEALNAAR